MEPKEQLAEVMKNTSLIALASSVEDLPNVRILDIFFDEKQNVVVFPTSALSPPLQKRSSLKRVRRPSLNFKLRNLSFAIKAKREARSKAGLSFV